MIHKTRGIVLTQYKYGESSLIVHVYTEQFGRQSYMVRGGHGRKSKSRSNILRPFFLLDMEVSHREGKEIQNLREIRLADTFHSLPYNIYKSTLCLFLAEVLTKVLREEESNPSLFEFLYESIRYLDLTQESVSNFHLFFLLQLTHFLGFYPQRNYDAEHSCFDMTSGSFITFEKQHSQCLNMTLSRTLISLMNSSIDNCNSLKINGEIRSEFLDSILRYYSHQIDVFTSVKSLAVLREIFH